jgi:hypothetical protein
VCLAAPCLPIGEDSTIIALNDRFNQRESCFIIHLPLGAFNTIDSIKCKILLRLTLVAQLDLIYIFVNFDTILTSIGNLFFIHGSCPNHDFNAFRHFINLKIKYKIIFQQKNCYDTCSTTSSNSSIKVFNLSTFFSTFMCLACKT